LIAQGRDLSIPLNQALTAQLRPDVLAALSWPTMSGRLIRVSSPTEITPPPDWSTIHQQETSYYLHGPRQLRPVDREWLAKIRDDGKVWSDEWTWPPISDTVGRR